MSDNYALVDASGHVTDVIVWDGVSPWAQPEGITLVKDASRTAAKGWSYAGGVFTAPPVPAPAPLSLPEQARLAILASDITMQRIQEAIALGQNTWTSPDVVAWVNYRRSLRRIVNGSDTTSTSLPTRPPYAAGT